MDQDAFDRDAADESSAPAASGSSQFRILLVEDESLIAEIIAEALTEEGYAVHAVASGPEAIAHLDAGEQVDLLFTDINLPGGMDGADLAERARCLRPGLPVIYASGRWGLLDALRSVPHSAVLQKPYSPARACSAVAALVGAACAPQKIALGL